MNEPQARFYEFDKFCIDAVKRLLLKGDGEIVPLMPKAFDTLLYLVQNSGKLIEKDELMSAIWADTIVEENNLTQNISILRRVLGEKHGENLFIVTVPGRGYKFVADVKTIADDRLRNADFEAEAEKISKDPIPKTKGQITKDKTTNRFWLISLGVFSILVLSSLGFYLWLENAKPASTAPIKTVAVLPFKPLVAEKRDEALEFGMADALIAKLSGGEEIIVRPLSAIRRYNAAEQDSVAAGRELAVEAVLDGSIQISGDRIRISAKLLRVGDGKQLWSEQFDEKFTDIFTVQDSISERVAAALKIPLGGKNKKRYTENVEAYELYMKGRYHALNLTRAETDKGIAYFQQAIELDPNYALAYVGLTEAYLPMALTSSVPSWEVLP